MAHTSNNPQETVKQWNIREFPRELRRRIKVLAAEEGIKVREWVIRNLTEAVERTPARRPATSTGKPAHSRRKSA